MNTADGVKVVATGAAAVLYLDHVHQIWPAPEGILNSYDYEGKYHDHVGYGLCMNPGDDGLCATHVYVRARDLAPILFPEG